MTVEVRVLMRHVRAAHLCSGGARAFFKRYGLDWNAFLTDGISSSKLEEIGDPMGMKAVAAARVENDIGR
jgi:hypothetical protein